MFQVAFFIEVGVITIMSLFSSYFAKTPCNLVALSGKLEKDFGRISLKSKDVATGDFDDVIIKK